jgi:7-carboxy-7-deazaguanine synthase
VRLAEIYRSVQGEGLLTGTSSVFIRVSGCNLRCWFCDTPYASWAPEGEDWPLDDIVAEVGRLAADHIVITGGEPMLYAELIPLCQRLQDVGRHITIETAGTLYLPVRCDLMSISPKLSNSTPPLQRAGTWASRHERTRHSPDVVRRLIDEHPWQLKFVVDVPADLAEIESYLGQFPSLDRRRVLLMPQGIDRAELAAKSDWLERLCREHGLAFCPRKHIEWFGAVRGT